MGLKGNTSISSNGLEIEPYIAYKYTFSVKNRPRIDCQKTRILQEERMRMENEMLRLQLESLKRQTEKEMDSNNLSDEW